MKPTLPVQHKAHANPDALTWIAMIRDAVEAWRKRNLWSRETTAMSIVAAHEARAAQQLSGIYFEPHTRDTFEIAKVNADRIFRWLDDVTKDRTLLPVNFIPSILAALPSEARRALIDDLLRGQGLASRELSAAATSLPISVLLQETLLETAQAEQSLAALLDGVDESELVTAQRELTEAIVALNKARNCVEAMMTGAIR